MDNPSGWLTIREGEVVQLSINIPSITTVTKHFVLADNRSYYCQGALCDLCLDGVPKRTRYQAEVISQGQSLRWEFGDDVYRQVHKLSTTEGYAAATITRSGQGQRTRYTIRPQSEANTPHARERDKYIHGRYGHMVQR